MIPLVNRGLTLIETLITTAILVTGLAAVVSVFAYSATTNANNQQRTAANAILYDKVEEFRATPVDKEAWLPGGSLNPEAPANGYFDYVRLDSTGTTITSSTNRHFPYLRIWQIEGTNPRTLTVIVYAQRAGLARRRLELIRAITAVSSTF